MCDTKTTKAALSEQYFKMYRPNNQVYAYLWAAREIMGLPVKGFIIEGVQTGANFCRFNRTVFNVSKTSIDEWYMDAQYSLSVRILFGMRVTTPQTLPHVVTMVAVSLEKCVANHQNIGLHYLTKTLIGKCMKALHQKGELIHAEDLFKKQNKK